MAELSLTLASDTSSSVTPVGVYPLTRAYTSSATWNSYDGSSSWASPGGDYDASSGYVNNNVGPAAGQPYYWYPTQAVQGWVDGTTPNDGFLLKETNEPASNQLTFYSGVSPEPSSDDPALIVFSAARTGDKPFYTQLSQKLDDSETLNINPATGNAEIHAVDFSVPGAGPAFTVQRNYESLSNWKSGGGQFDAGAWFSNLTDQTSEGTAATRLSQEAGDGSYLEFYASSDTSGVQPAAGVNATATQSGSQAVVTMNQSQEKVTTVVPNAQNGGLIQSDTDRNGQSLTYTYNACTCTETLNSVTDTEGRTYSVAEAGTGTYPQDVTSVTDNTDGRSIRYGYNASYQPHIATFTDAAGNVTQYTYDTAFTNMVTQVTTPAGREVKLAYNSNFQIISVTMVTNPSTGSGNTWTFSYALNGPNTAAGTTTVTDPNGHAITYYYDTKDRVTNVVDANGNSQQTSYTANFAPQNLTNGLSQVTTLSYDNNNNLPPSPSRHQAPEQPRPRPPSAT